MFWQNRAIQRLILPEEGLELGIERHITLIAMEQVQLDLGIPWAVQPDLIQYPGGRIQQRAITDTVFVTSDPFSEKHLPILCQT